jgi:hypothetical protein
MFALTRALLKAVARVDLRQALEPRTFAEAVKMFIDTSASAQVQAANANRV